LRMRLRFPQARAISRWYLDLGAGFNEQHALTVPLTSEQTVELFWPLDTVLHGLRFDPLDAPGEFAVECLQMSRIEQSLAQQKMLELLDGTVTATQTRRAVQQRACRAKRPFETQLACEYKDALRRADALNYRVWRMTESDRTAAVHSASC